MAPERSVGPGDAGPRSLAPFAGPPSPTAVSRLDRAIREGCDDLKSGVQGDLELANLLATVDEPGALRIVLDRTESRLRSFDRDLRSILASAAVEREAESVVAGAEHDEVRRPTLGFASPLAATLAGLIVAAVVVILPGPPSEDPSQAIAGAAHEQQAPAEDAATEDEGLPSLKSAFERRSSLILAWGLRAGYTHDPGPVMAAPGTPRSDRILERLAGAVDVYSRELRAATSDLQDVVKSVADKVPTENESDWILDVDHVLLRGDSDGDDTDDGAGSDEEDPVARSDSSPDDDGDEPADESDRRRGLGDGPLSDGSDRSDDAEPADEEEGDGGASDGEDDDEERTLTGLF